MNYCITKFKKKKKKKTVNKKRATTALSLRAQCLYRETGTVVYK
jgi:hypothetical protein